MQKSWLQAEIQKKMSERADVYFRRVYLRDLGREQWMCKHAAIQRQD